MLQTLLLADPDGNLGRRPVAEGMPAIVETKSRVSQTQVSGYCCHRGGRFALIEASHVGEGRGVWVCAYSSSHPEP